MPYSETILAILILCIIVLFWFSLNKVAHIKQLQSKMMMQEAKHKWVSNAIETAILFIEDQNIVWMNAAGAALFGHQLPKPFTEILYHPPDEEDLLNAHTTIKCQCLGLNGYLFPATIQVKRDPSTSVLMILVNDENFKGEYSLTLNRQHTPLRATKDSPSIVVIDDDESVLETYSEMLTLEGWTITSFSTASKALEHIEQHHSSISLIITDYQLKALTGVELLAKCHQFAPHIRGMLISGFNLNEPLHPDIPFLQKPCTRRVLVQTVESLLNDL
ncbi:MAG: response regulator [Myxococcota bacterium]|nr:response regulator [Myxococcota bacterium]MEC8381238.1 response regulator [Myxococcota bacterium]